MNLQQLKSFLICFIFLFSLACVAEENSISNEQIHLSLGENSSPKKIAICYWGLTRSTIKIYKSHFKNLFKVLNRNNFQIDIYMHTWKLKNKQRIWYYEIDNPVDYEEYKLLSPNFYQIDDQDEFTENLEFDKYFYKGYDDNPISMGAGDWPPEMTEKLVLNHLCALESLKRVTEMVENNGKEYDLVMYVRPDVLFSTRFPVNYILNMRDFDIVIPNFDHWAGLNDRFAVMTFKTAAIYGKRIDALAEFRRTVAKITSERYVKYVCDLNHLNVILVPFNFEIIRP